MTMQSVYVLGLANDECECYGCIDIIGIYATKEGAEKEEARLNDINTRYHAECRAIRTQFPNRLLDGLSGAEGAIAIEKHREEKDIVDAELKVCMKKYDDEVNVKRLHVGDFSNLVVLEMPLIMGE